MASGCLVRIKVKIKKCERSKVQGSKVLGSKVCPSLRGGVSSTPEARYLTAISSNRILPINWKNSDTF